MALPTLVKTWQFTVNQAIASDVAATSNANLLIGIKNALLGFATNPWTVVNSVSELSVGVGADTWGSASDVVWNTSGNRPWFVLQRVDGLQLLLAPAFSGSSDLLDFRFSKVGFSGGTITALPTATDDVDVLVTGSWGGTNTTSAHRYHVLHSTDGLCTRVLICRGGFCVGTWIVEKLKDPVPGFTNPNVCSAYGVAGAAADIALVTTNGLLAGTPSLVRYQHANIATVGGASNGKGFGSLTAEAVNAALLHTQITTLNDFDSTWPMLPMGAVGYTVGGRGKLGDVHDMWCGVSAVATASSYPADSSHQFAQFAGVIYPWNGTLPLAS